MQPGMNSLLNSDNLHHHNHHHPPLPPLTPEQQPISNFDPTTHDDFLDQMLSSLPSWNEFAAQNGQSKLAWDLKQDDEDVERNECNGVLPYQFDESAMLASKLRQNQINGVSSSSAAAAERMMMLQQQLVMPRGEIGQSGVGDGSLFNSSNSGFESSIQGLYNGFAESLQSSQSQQFLQSQMQSYGAPAGATMSQAQGVSSAGGAPAQPRQRVRARRGQATDPHSIAERLRRERIAERMKGLQELVPNANKTDKASMLDEIIDYVKFLQLQVKVLSMSRLGGAAAVAPLVADMSSERGDAIAGGRNSSSIPAQTPDDNAMTVTEQQVAKLMEEDMGSAMQYLQGKGLCLMPISLATAISTTTTTYQSRSPLQPNNNINNGPTSPTASVLTVQSAAFGNGVNDATSGLIP